MKNWTLSIYSDGTDEYVSNPQPSYQETVTIRLRAAADAPIEHVLLWSRQNGGQGVQEMQPAETRHGLTYYQTELTIREPRAEYRFYLVGEDRIWYYTQRGVTTYIPDHSYNFKLLSDYRQPAWVKHAVFYQIFPERFANGDPTNDNKDGEYTYFGDQPIHMKNWEDAPLPYEQGKCMDFFGGDLKGIEDKIPYLKRLGITAVYLNPIFEAPSTHKYDCIDYFHVDRHFGGDEALASLSTALHENGMKLVIDISINHTGTAHRWFNRDGMFFEKSEGAYNNPDSEERNYYFFKPDSNDYKGWWDLESLPVLNYTSEALRDQIYRKPDSVLRKWLKPPYNIDGWRFDVADVMAKNDQVQLADEVWPEICAAIREENPDAYILAEDWDECSERQQGGEWDAPMDYYCCCRPIRAFYGEHDYYMRQSEVIRKLNMKLRAEDMKEQILSYLGKLPFVMWQNQFNLMDSHDIPRFQNNPDISEQAVIGSAVLQFALIGTPSLYYGDEAEIDGWLGNIEGCRYPMPWSKDIEHLPMYKVYQTLAETRKREPALTEGGMQFLYAEGAVVAFARMRGDEAFIAVASSSKQNETIVLPTNAIGMSHISEKDVLGRVVNGRLNSEGELTLTLEPEGSLLFKVTCE